VKSGARRLRLLRTDRPPWLVHAILLFGVSAASLGAILVRYAGDAEPLALSLWRCGAGAVALLPFAGRGVLGTAPRAAKLSLVAGCFLAVHFATWITSVDLTSIAASVLLVSTTPVFVAVAGRLLFGTRLVLRAWLGILVALAGSALVAGGDFGGSSLVGDALALAGGAAAAGYVMAGARARQELGIFAYAFLAYAASALLLAVVCVAAQVPLWGYSATTWWAIAGLVAGPQILGHTIINFALRELDAATVSVSIMAEPVVATGLALLLFSEMPSWLVLPGGAAILAGIYAVSTAPPREAPSSSGMGYFAP
jgi:drug/metabolite transporter (DMT)-like permease